MATTRAVYVASLCAAVPTAGCVSTDPFEWLQVDLNVNSTAPSSPDSLEHAAPNRPLDVEVLVSNLGGEPVSIVATCGPPFRVIDRNGVVVGPRLVDCAGQSQATTMLLSGETVAFTGQWAGESLSGAQLPLGTYGIEAWTTRLARRPIETGITWVRLKEDPVSNIPRLPRPSHPSAPAS